MSQFYGLAHLTQIATLIIQENSSATKPSQSSHLDSGLYLDTGLRRHKWKRHKNGLRIVISKEITGFGTMATSKSFLSYFFLLGAERTRQRADTILSHQVFR